MLEATLEDRGQEVEEIRDQAIADADAARAAQVCVCVFVCVCVCERERERERERESPLGVPSVQGFSRHE